MEPVEASVEINRVEKNCTRPALSRTINRRRSIPSLGLSGERCPLALSSFGLHSHWDDSRHISSNRSFRRPRISGTSSTDRSRKARTSRLLRLVESVSLKTEKVIEKAN